MIAFLFAIAFLVLKFTQPKLVNNGVLKISVEGPMQDYARGYDPDQGNTTDSPWWAEKDDIIFVNIENGVTSIGSNAFYESLNLKTVHIPPSVTTIGHHAFYECQNLTAVTIPFAVTTIGERAFSRCDSLEAITILDNVTNIGNKSFYDCENLKSVSVPAHMSDEDIKRAFDNPEIVTRRE